MTNTNLVTQSSAKELNWDEALKNELWIAPFVNLYETKDDFILAVQMPGVGKENIRIKVENDSIIIMGRRPYSQLLNNNYLLKEIELGNYFRRFRIADTVDVTKIDAEYKDGILSITLPKHERVKPRSITIK